MAEQLKNIQRISSNFVLEVWSGVVRSVAAGSGHGQAIYLQVRIDFFQRTNLPFPHDSSGVFRFDNRSCGVGDLRTLLSPTCIVKRISNLI